MDADLAVLLVGDDVRRVRRAISAALRACAKAGLRAEVLIAWTAAGPAPDVPPAQAVAAFPGLGATHALNRVLRMAEAPLVGVVTGTPVVGTWAARLPTGGRSAHPVPSLEPVLDRQALVDSGGFDNALSLTAAVHEAASRGVGAAEPMRALGRLVARRQESRSSSRRALLYMPAELGLLPGDLEPLPPSARAKVHHVYRAPGRRVLHLYADPSPRLTTGVQEREAVRRSSPRARVPALLAAVPGPGCLWVLEEEAVGPALNTSQSGWWSGVADWLVELAGPPGDRLDARPAWKLARTSAVGAVPVRAQAVALAALNEVGTWPARHQHGDLQPKNVVMTSLGPAAVDWEGVWQHGLPGLDVLFLALMAPGHGPDAGMLAQLLGGQETPGCDVRGPLASLGVTGGQVRSLLTACLTLWTMGEARRNRQLGAPLTRRSSNWFAEQWHTWPGTA